jgi:uncharacterized protein YciI
LPIFALYCVDKPNSLELRMATREAHLEYVRSVGERLLMAGPLLDAAEAPAGSVLFVEAENLAAAQAFAAEDPYAKAGLFQNVTVTGFRPVFGKFA